MDYRSKVICKKTGEVLVTVTRGDPAKARLRALEMKAALLRINPRRTYQVVDEPPRLIPAVPAARNSPR